MTTALAFTDEALAPTRTTRRDVDPARDWREVLAGDELLVDVGAYTTEHGVVWCRVAGLAAYAYSSSEPWAESGVQYVGTTGTTLREAITKARETWNYTG